MSSSSDIPIVTNMSIKHKYQTAGQIASKVVGSVLQRCVPSQSVREMCEAADGMIIAETSLVFKEEKHLYKGVAFPTSISVNHCVCYFSPFKSDKDRLLEHGDLVKIELAVHIDGCVACVGYSQVVGATTGNPARGRPADVMLATHAAMEAYTRLIKGGVPWDYGQVKQLVESIVAGFHCKLMHLLPERKTQFHVNEVAELEVLVSTGEGLAYEYLDTDANIYRRTDPSASLPRSVSRSAKKFLAAAYEKYGTSGFSLRHFDNEKTARRSAQECVDHGILLGFPVLYEKEGELVALLKCTVGVTPTGIQVLSDCSLDISAYQSDYKIAEVDFEDLEPVVEEMAVPIDYHSSIIGEAGTNIRQLMDAFKVHINIPDATERSGVITIRGLRRNVDAAKEELAARVKELNRLKDGRARREYRVEMRVDPQLHFQLLGQRVHVKRLRDEFQVELQFPRADAAAENADKIVIIGLEEKAHAARAHIQTLIEVEKRKARVEVPLDSRIHACIIGDNRTSLKQLEDRFQVKIHFPVRVDEDTDVVTVVGEKGNVYNCKAELKRLEGLCLQHLVKAAGRQDARLKGEPVQPFPRGRPKKGTKPRPGVLEGMLRPGLRNRRGRTFTREEKAEVVGVYRMYPKEAVAIARILKCTGVSNKTIYAWRAECERASGHTPGGG
ncbi:uncharacterized protein LOC129590662 [Paramacrobiotus metropolitanus]|uniref:uncharacterized protein LOC129590662 n=1 Tax=Paramacrobiotus metropolitanus TaxID=2943436 RepID=UPI002445DE26|nr:uncharacterized protein LOC129590662 [Paramacrobiotus metropolitanus]